MVNVSIELSGGLELLFDNQKVFDAVDVDAPANVVPGTPVTMRHALHWIREHLLRQRPELFLSGDTVRPGILVLINEVDWELEGTLDYTLQPGDTITFISTLHGG